MKFSQKNAGFSLIEMMVGLGVGGVVLLGVGSLISNFSKSNRAATGGASQNDLTAQLSIALSDTDPVNCADNVIKLPPGKKLPINGGPILEPVSIHKDVKINGRPLAVIVIAAPSAGGLPDSTGNITTINLIAGAADAELNNHIPQGVSTPVKKSFLYTGSVEIQSTRVNPKTNEVYGAPLISKIPLSFEVDASPGTTNGTILSCSSRLQETDLDPPPAVGTGLSPKSHSINQCYGAGGVPMRSTSNKLVCHFTLPSGVMPALHCPPGWTATPPNSINCVLTNPTAEDHHLPPLNPANYPTYNPGTPRGRMYVTVPASGACPTDWVNTGPAPGNRLICTYYLSGCPYVGSMYVQAYEGDGTPYCKYQPSKCPPYFGTLPAPRLTCTLPNVTPAAGPTSCSTVFSSGTSAVKWTPESSDINVPMMWFNCW